MYTAGKMRRVVRPLALCVLLMSGTLPAAALACQWACATQDVQAGQVGHQGHAGHALQASQNRADISTVQSSTAPCDHVSAADPAIASGTLSLIAIAAGSSTNVVAPAFASPRAAVVASGTHSPPGARTAPLPLRV